MLALVAMRFLVPACRALIVSLPGDHARAVPVKATRAAKSPLRTATNLAAGPARPPTSRHETFSDAEREPSSIRYETSARARLAVKVERKPGAWSFFRVTSFVLIHLEKRDSFLPGTELQGVEQHPVAARGAFGFDGSGDVIPVLRRPGACGSAGNRPVIGQQHGKGAHAQ